MSALDTVSNVVDQVAAIAAGIKRKLSYFVLFGLVATGYLAWSIYSPDSAAWWNALKCGALAIPALIWVFIWSVLAQLQQAPELVSQLMDDDDGLFANLEHLSLSEPQGLSGVFNTLREFKQEDGLSVVFETLSGVGLLANPVFAIFAFAASTVLFIFILVALVLVIF